MRVPLRVPLRVPMMSAGLGLVGGAAVVAGAVIVGGLHITGPSARIDPIRRTISEYALLSNGWLFDMAVLLVAGGSVVVLVGLIRAGLLQTASLGAAMLALWAAGLAAVVAFPKHNWAVGPSASGDFHRAASVVAFLALPVAALAIGLAWRRRGESRLRTRVVVGLGLCSLLAFLPIPTAFLLQPWTGVRWWRAIPLGGVERALMLCEVAVVLALAAMTVWPTTVKAWRLSGRATDYDPAQPEKGVTEPQIHLTRG